MIKIGFVTKQVRKLDKMRLKECGCKWNFFYVAIPLMMYTSQRTFNSAFKEHK